MMRESTPHNDPDSYTVIGEVSRSEAQTAIKVSVILGGTSGELLFTDSVSSLWQSSI